MRFMLLALIIFGCKPNIGVFIVDKESGIRHKVASCKVDARNEFILAHDLNSLNELAIKHFNADHYYCEIWDFSSGF